ncbi:TatD family hydrolase [Lacticaseibacillus daqingensis]|uniref:TatD family hydrolase n=1 Tax=Lacticaseibacillus daqingensis TaxID=2486014 RepID=UPI0013DDB692|nr:TatD family hydrolase [Lacticaseibacillus daqingensis]
MLSDAHCHDDAQGTLARVQQRAGIPALINCATPAEWHHHRRTLGPQQWLSVGVHPWASATPSVAAMGDYFAAASVIGEIGLDRVWTTVPLTVQRPVFTQQLALAQRLGKPVVLHTKGCEAEVLARLVQYPNRYFVHWYSAATLQAEYLAAGCYMSIGPDVLTDPAVQVLARRVPLSRLLLESDGLESLTWAWHRPVPATAYVDAMTQCAQAVAALRECDVATVTAAAARNLSRFVTG